MTVTDAARTAHDSDAAQWGARAGLVARGLVWLVVGLLAVRIAAGGGGTANRDGAFQALRDQPLGKALLVAMALAFAAHAVFRALEGTVGRREETDDRKRLLKRAWSWCRVVVYGSFAVATVSFLMSGGKSEDAKGPTAQVLHLPAGRWLVGLLGVGLVVGGLVQAYRGLKQDFSDTLRLPAGTWGTVVKRIGTGGLVGRGLVYALVGSFLVEAAVSYQPSKAKGLDEALKSLADRPYGPLLLGLVATGLVLFGLWSFLEARYKDI